MPRHAGEEPATARLRRGGPFGLVLLLIQAYVAIGPLLLGFADQSELGEYFTALKIPLAINALASLWLMVFYPHATAVGMVDRPHLKRDAERSMTAAALASIPIVVAAAILGDDLMALAFGEPYRSAGPVLAILCVWAAAVLQASCLIPVLMALGLETSYAKLAGTALVASAGVSVLLVWSVGAVGAALGVLASELVIVAGGARLLRRVGSLSLSSASILNWRVGASTAVAAGVMAASAHVGGAVIACMLGTSAYLVTVHASGAADLRASSAALIRRLRRRGR
jgi:O-antigen/teichoic acid export membrane protein